MASVNRKAGAPVTTPWLETTVSPAKNGDWLAVVRTGSSAQSSLVSLRSADHGRTWSSPEKLPIAGKLPTLQLLPNGMLALLTAHSKNHCRLHLSSDGTGRDWGDAQILPAGWLAEVQTPTPLNPSFGKMWWTNETSHAYGALDATMSWSIPSIPLALGVNAITVSQRDTSDIEISHCFM